MLLKAFPVKIQTIQTDNGTEFTYKYISETEISPLDKVLNKLGIKHKLIPPRTPWHKSPFLPSFPVPLRSTPKEGKNIIPIFDFIFYLKWVTSIYNAERLT